MRALIDLDIVLYRASAAAQKVRYTVYQSDGRAVLAEFYSAKEAKQFAAGNPDLEIASFVIPGEFNHAIHNFRASVDAIVSHTGSSSYALLGSDTTENLYRYKLSTVRPYKGNRDTTSRPYFYYRLKEFIYSKYDVEVRPGLEADDLLGIYQENDTVICSIDKDLDQVPGNHYNFDKKLFYTITREEGEKVFWKQLIMGDSTDNIVGIPGFGPLAADRLLHANTTRQALEIEILEQYNKAYPGKGKEIMIENARLVKILQEDNEKLWEPLYV